MSLEPKPLLGDLTEIEGRLRAVRKRLEAASDAGAADGQKLSVIRQALEVISTLQRLGAFGRR